ncbi:MAG: FimV/HubP family polar landmark protein [Pseudomonadota bacterium]
MNHPRRWRIGAVAAAIALAGTFTSLQVQALGLGRITVQSALGEPLRAEIDIPEINAEEAASLRASVASADAFKAAGLEYTAAVTNLQISLQRRPDGRSYLRLSSDRPVSEPFVDLILEARWASGRIVRDYTMLFDPPNLRAAAQPMPAPTAPMVSRPPAPVATLPPAPAAVPYSPPRPPAVMPAPAVRPAAPPVPAPAVTTRAPSPSGQTVTVKTGDTAGKIAAQTKPANISLDQMLVALLRSNPDAFIGGNVNRLKAGAVLEVPSADQAEAVSASEASQTIVAQSRDFNAFRRKLAESAPATQTAGADRQATGQVQAKVEDKAPAAATPDKLTLSKGAVQGKAAAEEKIAQDRQAKEAAARVAELSKNIADLNKLGSPSTPAPAAAPAAPAAPGVTVASPGALPGTPPAATAPAAPMAPASSAAAVTPAPAATAALPAASAAAGATPAASAAAPAPAPVKKPVVVPPPPPPETSLVDELLENPLILAGAAILLLLLLALGVYRARQSKNSVAVDSSFLESRLQPDSFFGASGGQRIDTNEANVTGSSMVYSPSQLDAAGDVDPVAEADVYLAYGRDLQAEEILKEAIRVSPTRIAIHAKLMEIYAKRRDAAAFAAVATDAFNLTKGHGGEWAHMAEMGRDLDPGNPMYQPDGQPPSAATVAAVGIAGASYAAAAAAAPPAFQTAPEPEASAVDFDLDLDFSMGDEAPAPAPAPAPVPRTEQTLAMPVITAAAPLDNGMDFSSATLAMPTAAPAPAVAEPLPSMDEGLSFTTDEPAVTTAATPLDTSSGMLEFDMGALSLDLDGPTTESQAIAPAPAPAPAPASTPAMDLEDPLETKFALAEEFRAIGDADGARSLAEEVLAQSSGSLKAKAQAFLNALA